MSGTMRDRTELAHINLAGSFRGGERQTEMLVRELARRGWRQQFIGRRGAELPDRLAGVSRLSVVTARTVAGAAFRVRAPLVHAHEARAAQGAWLASRFGSRRYVITRRVTNRPSRSFVTERVYRHADAVCSVSRSVAEVLENRFHGMTSAVVPDAWTALPLNPETAAAIRARFPGRLLVGCVAALEESKGLLVLIEAARRLLAARDDLAFLVIGDGKDAGIITAAAQGIEQLAFTGYVRNVGDYLDAMDVFVLPSLREGLGSSILEAMAQGIPVIATATGGVPEIVTDEETGMLVKPGDSPELASAIGALVDDSIRRQRIADAARERIAGLHIETVADRYESLYAEIMRTGTRTAHRSRDRSA